MSNLKNIFRKNINELKSYQVSRDAYLNKKGILVEWSGLIILNDLSAVVMLNKIEAIQTGDHKLFVFDYKKDYLTCLEII